MANYESLKSAIRQVIKPNGNEEITGQVLQDTLISLVSSVGQNATFAGVAVPTTNPQNPDGNVFYLAFQNGTYSNFGGIVVADEVAILSNVGGSWAKISAGIANNDLLQNLQDEINNASIEVVARPLFSNNTLGAINNYWFSIYKLPLKAGKNVKFTKAAVGLLTPNYSYYIITDVDGVVLTQKNGTSTVADAFVLDYTMPKDGFVSLCYSVNDFGGIKIDYKLADKLISIVNDATTANNMLRQYVDDASKLTKVNYPLLVNNTLSPSEVSNWPTIYKLPLSKGRSVSYVKKDLAALSPNYSYIIITDLNGVVLTRKDGTGVGETDKFNFAYTMPEDGFVSLCFNVNADVKFDYMLTDGFMGLRANIAEIKANTPIVNNVGYDVNKASFRGFYKFGVIGDSLSVGYMTNAVNGEFIGRNINFSWGQILARKNGQKCLNFGFSGATATAIMNNTTPYNEVALLTDSDNLCQCYVIGLGANNDTGGNGNVSMDIDWSDRDNNAMTFAGQYARIVQLLRATAPQALIFCLALPYPRENTAKNAIIRAIATDSHVNSNTFFVDLTQYNDLLKNSIVGDVVVSGRTYDKYYYDWHFTASGYAMCADMTEKAISDVMNANTDKAVLNSIGQIPYGSTDILP